MGILLSMFLRLYLPTGDNSNNLKNEFCRSKVSSLRRSRHGPELDVRRTSELQLRRRDAKARDRQVDHQEAERKTQPNSR